MDMEPIPTEFDSTTNAIMHTLTAMGVEDATLEEDMSFLTNMFMAVTRTDPENVEPEHTTRVLDCAFIGLLYHRHMPFQILESDGTIGELTIPERAPNDYVFTLNAVTQALVRQVGINPGHIAIVGLEGGTLGRSHLRDLPEGLSDDDPDVELHKQFMALVMLGMLVHRLLPRTTTSPKEQGIHGNE